MSDESAILREGPFMRCRLEGAEVVFMLGADDEARTVENIDVMVALDDGSRWSATLLTVAEIQRIMDRWRSTGECAAGAYFCCPDLLIIDRGGTDRVLEVLRSLLAAGDIETTLTPLPSAMGVALLE